MMKKTTVGLMLASLTAGASAATVFYENDFDGTSPQTDTYNGGTLSNIGYETAETGFGPAWQNKYAVNRSKGNPATESEITLDGLASHDSINVSFTLGFLESWDNRDDRWSPDFLDFLVDDNVVATLRHDHSASSGTRVYMQGAAIGEVINERVQANGNRRWVDTLVNMNVAFNHTLSSLTFGIVAYGEGWQGGNDEAWGIDNLVFSFTDGGNLNNVTPDISSVPLPGAVWLFGTALAGFAGYGRYKKSR